MGEYLPLTVVAAICLGLSQQTARETTPVQAAYELYSWQDARGEWSFAILPHTSREKTVKEVFSSKTQIRGWSTLQRRISKLPADATVFWLDRIPSGTGPKAKGSERLRLPPPDEIEQVRRSVQTRGIKLEILPGGSS